MSPNAESSKSNDVEEGLARNEEPLAAGKQKSVGTRLSTVSKKYDRYVLGLKSLATDGNAWVTCRTVTITRDISHPLCSNSVPLLYLYEIISRSFHTFHPPKRRNGKGYLDENEQKLRDMDTSNRGFLTNEKVYALLEEQMKLQKTLVTQRKLLVGLCAFAVILALANMGTAVSDSYLYSLDRFFPPY